MTALLLTPISPDDALFRASLALADLPTDDLEAEQARYFMARNEGQVVGFGGYGILTAHMGLLRSCVLLPSWRGMGLGKALVRSLLGQAKSEGLTQMFLLTTDQADFFAKLRFHPVGRAEAPPPVRASAQFSRLCPKNARLMHREI